MPTRTPARTEPDAPPHPGDPALPSDRTTERASQATRIEQARAVEEVRAAILVAQSVPRDTDRAVAEMRDACGRMALAEHAFYAVQNRGSGPSVHLARELARIWGNLDYGVRELRRDDLLGESEILAFAWDQQANVRSTRSFINPHARMANKRRQSLVDLGDIYLSNQNIGARAVRECVYAILPRWFTDEAQTICRRTIEHGEGVPLEDRKAAVIERFAALGVDVARLEGKIGRKRGQWTASDVADAIVWFKSADRDRVPVDELVPPLPGTGRVTAAEVTAGAVPTPEPADDDEDEAWVDQAKAGQ